MNKRSFSTIVGGSVLAVGAFLLTSSTLPMPNAHAQGGAGGGGGGAAVCDPISSLKTKPDARVGDFGFASIAFDYSTKACDADPVNVSVVVYEYNTGAVTYQDDNAPAVGKFTLNGVKLRTTYVIRVTVTNTVTGVVEGTKSSFTVALPKGA